MTTTSERLSGYKPRHKGKIETDFCENKCVLVDGIKVPHPDCSSHGSPFNKENMGLGNPFTTNQ